LPPPSRVATIQGMATTVIVVDDDAGFRRAATALLRQRGYEVVGEAAGGDDGLAVAAELDPDAVLLDVNLGEGDGVELARRLCRGDRPRVLLTSSDRDAVAPELLAQCPARGFVPKADIALTDLDPYLRG
jgi:DNA-binding NarL/FixJ family response regulator